VHRRRAAAVPQHGYAEEPQEATTMMPLTVALTARYAALAEAIPAVFTATCTFATLWAALCRIAGEPVPADVTAVLDAPLDLAPVPGPVYRGASADHADRFTEVYAD